MHDNWKVSDSVQGTPVCVFHTWSGHLGLWLEQPTWYLRSASVSKVGNRGYWRCPHLIIFWGSHRSLISSLRSHRSLRHSFGIWAISTLDIAETWKNELKPPGFSGTVQWLVEVSRVGRRIILSTKYVWQYKTSCLTQSEDLWWCVRWNWEDVEPKQQIWLLWKLLGLLPASPQSSRHHSHYVASVWYLNEGRSQKKLGIFPKPVHPSPPR